MLAVKKAEHQEREKTQPSTSSGDGIGKPDNT